MKTESILAQFPYQHLSNYWEITSRNDPYYDSLVQVRGLDQMRGTGFRQYMRWKRDVRPNIPPDGDLHKMMEKKLELSGKTITFLGDNQDLKYSADWREVGPLTSINNNSEIGSIGRLSTCATDRSDPNYIFASSPMGGLFYSDNGGLAFQAGGTDDIPYPNSVSSIVISTVDAVKYWFIATGDKDNHQFSSSGGIYRSTNLGEDWTYAVYGLPQPEMHIPYKITRIIAHPTNPNIMFAATTPVDMNSENTLFFTNGIYQTTNALSDHPNWTLINQALSSIMHSNLLQSQMETTGYILQLTFIIIRRIHKMIIPCWLIGMARELSG